MPGEGHSVRLAGQAIGRHHACPLQLEQLTESVLAQSGGGAA